MKTLPTALIIATAATLSSGPGSAAPRHRARAPAATAYSAPPLTIQRRSYLDPGNSAPVGSLNQYVWAPSIRENMPWANTGETWRYGDQTLPDYLEVPGRPEPIVDF